MARRRAAAVTDDLLDLRADRLETDAQRLEGLGRDAFALVDQSEQDVLGADVVVVEQPRFLLREDNDSAGPVGEALEHDGQPFLAARERLVENLIGRSGSGFRVDRLTRIFPTRRVITLRSRPGQPGPVYSAARRPEIPYPRVAPLTDALVVDDRGEPVHRLDQVGLVGHHGLEVLVRIRMLVDQLAGRALLPGLAVHAGHERLGRERLRAPSCATGDGLRRASTTRTTPGSRDLAR